MQMVTHYANLYWELCKDPFVSSEYTRANLKKKDEEEEEDEKATGKDEKGKKDLPHTCAEVGQRKKSGERR